MKTKQRKKTRSKPTLREHITDRLVDLPDTKGDVSAVRVRSVSDAIQFLRAGMPITTAGDKGAVVVWKDDHGLWRGEFMRFRATLSQFSGKFLAGVCAWLREQWPNMGR